MRAVLRISAHSLLVGAVAALGARQCMLATGGFYIERLNLAVAPLGLLTSSPIGAPSSEGGLIRHSRPLAFGSRGEVPWSVLNSRETFPVPLDGDWSHSSWSKTYDRLHGNNIKIVAKLSNGKAKLLDTAVEAYEVIVRPLKRGGGPEIIAFFVDRTLGFHRIPSTSLFHPLLRIDTPWMNYTDRVSMQSRLRNVEMVFIDEGWLRCLPDAGDGHRAPVGLSGKGSRKIILTMQNGTTVTVRLQKLPVIKDQFYHVCARNMSLHDSEAARICLPLSSSRRYCAQQDVAELLELASFDVLINHKDRVHAESPTNNFHVFIPNNYSGPLSNQLHPFQAVWLDNGHYTFGEEHNELVETLFRRHCVFGRDFLLRLFGPKSLLSLGGPKTSLEDLVRHRMGSQLVGILNRHFLRDDSKASSGGHMLPVQNFVGTSLSVLDTQLELLKQAVASCARKNGNGFVHVL